MRKKLVKSRRYRKRGGNFSFKKICIDYPDNNQEDYVRFGVDPNSEKRIAVSKRDLERHIQDGSSAAKYHLFRRFSRKKGVCMSPADFQRAKTIYLRRKENEVDLEKEDEVDSDFNVKKAKEAPFIYNPTTPIESSLFKSTLENTPLFSNDLSITKRFPQLFPNNSSTEKPPLFKGGKKKSKAFKRHV